MFNKKICLLLLAMATIYISPRACAKVAISDLILPKAPSYRVGISDVPENQYIEAIEDKNSSNPDISADENFNNDVSYADLSIKRLSAEISRDLEYEEQDMVSDLSLLWQGAAMQSDTINFALYKLANPDSDKPDKGTVKKVLQTLASMSTFAGASMANPLLAGTSFIGGNVLSIMSQDTKALNYKYTKVTDADMIILIRKVEDLQQNAVNLYYDYMCAKKQYEMMTNLLKERKERFETAQKNNISRELIVITDAYYRTALDKQKTARSEFLSKRAALEQFVGNEAFTQFENELYKRENSINTDVPNTDNNQMILNSTNKENNISTSDFSKIETNQLNFYQYDDVNLDKLPDLEPLIIPDNSNENTTEFNQIDISSKQNELETQKGKTKKSKEEKLQEKYSTKGLIFLHNGEPKVQEQTSLKVKRTKSKEEVQTQTTKTNEQLSVEKPIKSTPNEMELLPLDTIRVPDLQNGYSIFGE